MDSQTTKREKDRQKKGLKKPTNWYEVMRKYAYAVNKISYHQPLCSRKQDYGGLLGGDQRPFRGHNGLEKKTILFNPILFF
jgi:hypothetical protein